MSKKQKQEKQEEQNDNIVNSKYHTLVVTEVPEQKVPVGEEGLFGMIPARKHFKLYVGDFGEDGRGTHAIIDKLRQSTDSADTLELSINSNGGYVNELKVYHNMVTDMFNGKTMTVLDSCGFSAGAIMFLMGDERVVYESSELMFHTYSTVYWGKSGDIGEAHRHSETNLQPYFYSMLVDEGYMTKKEFKQMCLGKDFWLSTPEMCERGIATHVMVYGHKIAAKHYMKLVDGKWDFEKVLAKTYPQ